ncbi:MAG: right-handed parallel beta-helix repeat-containing protein [Candidatus Thorarchaeota archaeon]|nr:right-handed parallel beta-helix repeat-containing protein [Candidatus Thorarchaeota archaeon]
MSRGKTIFALILGLILLFGSFSVLHPVSTNLAQSKESTNRETTIASYVQHNPVVINNDTALASFAVSGTGDPATPYILEGWNVTTSADSYGIYIGFTTKHFILRDCWVRGAMNDAYRGVLIYTVASGTAVIERVHCELWFVGIEVSSSPETVVRGCSVQDCYDGLMMTSSNNCTVFNNTAFENDEWGIWTSSPSSIVANNTLWDNAHGIKVYYATDVLLENNTLNEDGFFFQFDNVAGYESINESNNVVNGLPLLLLINDVGTIFNGGIGQAVLINCTGVKLADQNLSYCESGLFLRWCVDCEIRDSYLDYNDDSGVYVYYSDSINVENVSMTGNSMYALQLIHCTVDVLDCDFVENKRGIELVGTWGVASLQKNRFVNSTDYGLLLNPGWNVSASDNTFTEDGVSCQSTSLPDYIKYSENFANNLVNGKSLKFYHSIQDVIVSSPHGQVFLANCSNVVLSSLDCSHTVIGVGITLSNNCRIINSDCSHAKQLGISIIASNFTLVQNVNCDGASGSGIWIIDAEETTLIDNRCSNCCNGIDFLFSQHGLIKGNTLANNHAFGFRFLTSQDVYISSNICEFSGSSGLFVETSSGLSIVNNTCSSNNAGGIDIWDSYEILIHDNNCRRNRFSGVSLMASWTCTIALNQLVENEAHGLHISGGYGFEVNWNTMTENGGDGIRATCGHSRILHNVIALNNDYGAYLQFCTNVSIHHNMFVNNNGSGVQAYDSLPFVNLWYDPIAAEGNYWSDWDGMGPYYVDGGSGSCDIYPLGEIDSDSDTLPDSWEIANGLDPYSPDSDMDSLPDAWEVMYGLNPLANDTAGDHDGDGLSNLEEFLLGLNPASEDSDGDQMPDLWEVQNYLNPLYNDAGFDPDGDDISNLYEYYGGTNPHVYNGPSATTTTTTGVTTELTGDTLIISIAAIGGFTIAIIIIAIIVRSRLERR